MAPTADPPGAIVPGERIEVPGIGVLEIEHVTQRNWSRVAPARSGARRYFVKQFIDRIGRWHQRGFDGDASTAALLGCNIAGVRVLPALHKDVERLLVVFPYVEMTTIDSFTGRHRDRIHEVAIADRVGTAMADILRARRSTEQPDRVDVWKGLDPKNLGVAPDGTLWVFDFGPLTTLSLREAAALAVAAGLLSRWVARPGRHLVAPERRILRGVCEPLVSMTDLEHVQRSLDRHRSLRLREPQREGLAGMGTRLAILTIGRVHWWAAEREARRLFRSR